MIYGCRLLRIFLRSSQYDVDIRYDIHSPLSRSSSFHLISFFCRLVFSVGTRELRDFRMIERHYFRDQVKNRCIIIRVHFFSYDHTGLRGIFIHAISSSSIVITTFIIMVVIMITITINYHRVFIPSLITFVSPSARQEF